MTFFQDIFFKIDSIFQTIYHRFILADKSYFPSFLLYLNLLLLR